MGSEWQTRPFGDLYSIPSRNGLTKPKRTRGEGYKFVNMGEIFTYERMNNIPCDRVPASDKELDTSTLEPGDLLFARQSLVLSGAGKCSIFLGDEETVIFESHLIRVRPDSKIIEPLFLYYYFNCHIGRSEVWGITEQGAGQAGIRGSDLEKIKVSFPNLKEQKDIVGILSAIDDKIELNRQMNATLEAMAQALFKSWFVDFDPVIDNALAAGNPIPEPLQKRSTARAQLCDQRKRLPENIQKQFPNRFVFTEEMGWIPEGWEIGRLGEYVTVKRGGSPRPIHDYLVEEGLPWVKISDATASSSRFIMGTKQFIKKEGLRKTIKLEKGELILSNSATPGLPKFLELDACIHDGWLFFPEKRVFKDNYLYQLFLVVRGQLIKQGNGSVFTNLKTDILKNHIVVVPDEEVLAYFENEISFFHNRVQGLQTQISVLSKLRDILLPKLLSGEIRLAEAEKVVSEAL